MVFEVVDASLRDQHGGRAVLFTQRGAEDATSLTEGPPTVCCHVPGHGGPDNQHRGGASLHRLPGGAAKTGWNLRFGLVALGRGFSWLLLSLHGGEGSGWTSGPRILGWWEPQPAGWAGPWGKPDNAPTGGKSCRLRMSNLLSSGRAAGRGGGDGRARAPLCTTDQGSPSLRGADLTTASTPSSRMKHSDSAGRRQEVEGANVLGLVPWRCQQDSASAGAGVLLVIAPVHGKVVLLVVIMLWSPVQEVLRWEISFAWFGATVAQTRDAVP